ncbi:MAG: hypothetical protein COT55_03245 [Candidatus Diapherotrites archaeon CG09_land_8_20_14_0_10_32_12]|nr:MAG: hypothetical protein COT55_03245 [Candidatus Diapherotrites archaeon CG09_land_8_20_14_0_10_32_12]
METDQDYANATLIIRENENYSIIRGKIDLTIYNPIISNIRFSDFLSNPGLIAKPGEAIKPTKITVETDESEDQNVKLSDIVIALENAKYRGNRFDRRRASRSSLKKEHFSFSTEDNQYKVSGYVINLKKQMKNKFVVVSDDTPIGHLFPEEVEHKNYVILEDLVTGEISEHTFIAINPNYFEMPKK